MEAQMIKLKQIPKVELKKRKIKKSESKQVGLGAE